MESNTDSAIKKVNVAIVGCGAVTEQCYLPALQRSDRGAVTALIDINQERTQYLGDTFGIKTRKSAIEGIKQYADVAILAVPHHLHSTMAVELLQQGLHVFVEKPLAVSLNEAEAIINASKKYNKIIGVGLMRRFYESSLFVKEALQRNWIGEIISFDVREGMIYRWPAVSDALFKKDAGGGVLYDTGAHTLDLLLWWLGDFEDVQYSDDSYGGVEANCELHITLKTGVKGIVELSRTRQLRNTYRIIGKNGELEIGAGSRAQVSLGSMQAQLKGDAEIDCRKRTSEIDIMRHQIDNFANAIVNNKDPFVIPKSALKSIRLFDACKRNRKALDQPWAAIENSTNYLREFDGKKILVLGGTGFIGGRLVEILARETSAHIRTLVRNLARLPRISRFNIEIFHGDVTDRNALAKSISGCDIIFNCTLGIGNADVQKAVNIDSIKAIIEESARNNVSRIVHLSTISVYGYPADGILDEACKRRAPKSDIYGYTKRMGEKIALDLSKKLGVFLSVIQPTIVYGPDASSWTVAPLKALKSGVVVLADGGRGFCDAVYIDDVIQAMVLAATRDEAVGDVFLISGDEPTTWYDFYETYQKMVGVDGLTSMSIDKIKVRRKELLRSEQILRKLTYIIRENQHLRKQILNLKFINILYRLLRATLPQDTLKRLRNKIAPKGIEPAPKQMHLPNNIQIKLHTSKARVRIDKAKSKLGYRPRYDISQGMRKTKQWVHWSDLA
jgi:predicted dehydrogenase/nucleoside-diphosphate-sugar epimerase